MNVNPGNSAEKFSDLAVCLIVPFLVTFPGKRSPEGPIRPDEVLLNGSGTDGQNWGIRVPY